MRLLLIAFIIYPLIGKTQVKTTVGFMGGVIRDSANILSKELLTLKPGDTIMVYELYSPPYWRVSKGRINGYLSEASINLNDKLKETSVNVYYEKLKKEDERLAELYRKYKSYYIAKGIKEQQIWIGMNYKMVEDALGRCYNTQRTETAYGITEVWVYGKRFLHFKNGILEAISEY